MRDRMTLWARGPYQGSGQSAALFQERDRPMNTSDLKSVSDSEKSRQAIGRRAPGHVLGAIPICAGGVALRSPKSLFEPQRIHRRWQHKSGQLML